MDQARALRELQAALHLRIDAVYASLPPLVHRILRRHVTRDALTIAGAALAYAELQRLLVSVDERTAPLIAQGVAAAGVLPQQDEPDIELAWIIARGALTARYLFSIQQILATSRTRALSQVQRVIYQAVRTQRPVSVITIQLEQYVNPWYSTRRDETGALRRAERIGARLSGPAAPGMGSAPARGIMLTETSDAHGQMSVSVAQRTPGALIRWRLSPFHKDADECDAKAHRDSGFGPGIYWPTTVPTYPSHTRCACILDIVRPRPGVTA